MPRINRPLSPAPTVRQFFTAGRLCALLGLALALSGCGSGSGEKTDDTFKAKAREYFAYKDKNREILAALPEMKEQLPTKQAALTTRQGNLAEKKAELEIISKADETAYAKVEALAARPHLDDALVAAAKTFLRDFPLSPRAKDAQAILDKLQPAMAEAEAKKKIELEKQRLADIARRRDLDARFGKRELTAAEMQDYLLGRSQTEIITMLGEPDSRNSMYWDYPRAIMLVNGKPRGAQLIFDAGRVKRVVPQ